MTWPIVVAVLSLVLAIVAHAARGRLDDNILHVLMVLAIVAMAWVLAAVVRR